MSISSVAVRFADQKAWVPAVSIRENLALYIVPRIPEDRSVLIAKAAYFRAQRRGFVPGHELEDWLAAENEVDQRLAGEGRVF